MPCDARFCLSSLHFIDSWFQSKLVLSSRVLLSIRSKPFLTRITISIPPIEFLLCLKDSRRSRLILFLCTAFGTAFLPTINPRRESGKLLSRASSNRGPDDILKSLLSKTAWYWQDFVRRIDFEKPSSDISTAGLGREYFSALGPTSLEDQSASLS